MLEKNEENLDKFIRKYVKFPHTYLSNLWSDAPLEGLAPYVYGHDELTPP
jgi:hypothetical protein